MTNCNSDKKIRHVELYIVLFLLLLISVGFSYLSTQLNIMGNTTIKKQTWDVHFGEPMENSGYISGTSRNAADRGSVTLKSGSTLEVDFTADLEYPGDYYEFSIPVENRGTIDAMIAESGITNIFNNNDLVTYTVQYNYASTPEDKLIAVKDGIHANRRIYILVRVEYNKNVTNDQVNNMASGGININSTYSMTFVQADATANYRATEFEFGLHSG